MKIKVKDLIKTLRDAPAPSYEREMVSLVLRKPMPMFSSKQGGEVCEEAEEMITLIAERFGHGRRRWLEWVINVE